MVSNALITNVDFAPTLLGMLGIEIPDSMQGKDLSGTLFRNPSKGNESVLIQYEHTYFREDPEKVFRTVVTHRWKYTYYLTMGPTMLFDLENDPYEQRNLIDEKEYSPMKEKMHEILIEKLKEVKDTSLLQRMGCR